MNSIKQNLAIAYRVLAHLGLDDHTYTHLSVRAEDGNSYYIYPFGLRFEEVTAELLLRVSFDGVILEGTDHTYNLTGYMVHCIRKDMILMPSFMFTPPPSWLSQH